MGKGNKQRIVPLSKSLKKIFKKLTWCILDLDRIQKKKMLIFYF